MSCPETHRLALCFFRSLLDVSQRGKEKLSVLQFPLKPNQTSSSTLSSNVIHLMTETETHQARNTSWAALQISSQKSDWHCSAPQATAVNKEAQATKDGCFTLLPLPTNSLVLSDRDIHSADVSEPRLPTITFTGMVKWAPVIFISQLSGLEKHSSPSFYCKTLLWVGLYFTMAWI